MNTLRNSKNLPRSRYLFIHIFQFDFGCTSYLTLLNTVPVPSKRGKIMMIYNIDFFSVSRSEFIVRLLLFVPYLTLLCLPLFKSELYKRTKMIKILQVSRKYAILLTVVFSIRIIEAWQIFPAILTWSAIGVWEDRKTAPFATFARYPFIKGRNSEPHWFHCGSRY